MFFTYVIKADFSVSHDPSEISIICWFAAQYNYAKLTMLCYLKICYILKW